MSYNKVIMHMQQELDNLTRELQKPLHKDDEKELKRRQQTLERLIIIHTSLDELSESGELNLSKFQLKIMSWVSRMPGARCFAIFDEGTFKLVDPQNKYDTNVALPKTVGFLIKHGYAEIDGEYLALTQIGKSVVS